MRAPANKQKNLWIKEIVWNPNDDDNYYEVGKTKNVFSKKIRPKCEAICVVGSGDKIVSTKAITKYFNEVEKCFSLKVFDGAFHEMHNEIEKYRSPYLEFLKNSFMECLYR